MHKIYEKLSTQEKWRLIPEGLVLINKPRKQLGDNRKLLIHARPLTPTVWWEFLEPGIRVRIFM